MERSGLWMSRPLMRRPITSRTAVDELRRALDAELPAVRAILNDHADEPALAFETTVSGPL